jgi:hypothetical protein
MSKFLFLSIVILVSINMTAQTNWTIEEMLPLPEPVTNNAVCEGFVEVLGVIKPFVFSFGGIDSTLSYSGIHNKVWSYSVNDNTWQSLSDIPSTQETIASSASFVNGKIYIIGGYTVGPTGNEVSSSEVHIYDPATGIYSLGSLLTNAIDDQIQCVYKDSLIYVVSGWSNFSSINKVQIYDTYNDTWLVNNNMPPGNDYPVFGSNGIIVGDTLYYYGGASNQTSFPAKNLVRKGYINPTNPFFINWTKKDYLVPNAYRMACTTVNDTVFWIGGSETSYNYDAVAYDGSGIVEPSNQIFQYDKSNFEIDNTLEIPMDIRGIVSINETTKFLAGGMESNGIVSNKLLKLTWRKPTRPIVENIQALKEYKIQIQNPVENNTLIFSKEVKTIKIMDLNGRLIFEQNNVNSEILKVIDLEKSVYFIMIDNRSIKKIITYD